MAKVKDAQARWVKGILRAEMAKRDMTYAELAKCLDKISIKENEKNLANKIARGNFSAGLFLACLSAMGTNELTFESLIDYINNKEDYDEIFSRMQKHTASNKSPDDTETKQTKSSRRQPKSSD